MADSSSTSNSEARPAIRFGVPWGLIGAIVLIAIFELSLRGIGRLKLIAFASDEGQYHAVRDFIDAQGVADVALVGSSQMREAVSMPHLTEVLKKLAGREVWAANYAMRGARVDVIDAAVRYMRRQSRPPELIVVALSPRDVRAEQPDWPRVAIFWTPADWLREVRQDRAAFAALPIVVRSEVGRVLWSLRYREEIALWLQRRFAHFGVDGSEDRNPIIGEMTAQHVGPKGEAFFGQKSVSPRRLLDRVAESYLADRPAAVPGPMRRRMERLADASGGGAVGARSGFDQSATRTLWVELPVASLLKTWLIQQGQQAAFDTLVTGEAARAGVEFLPVEDQPYRPVDPLFRDLQHLNRPGAEQFCDWLGPQIWRRMSDRSAAASQATRPR